MTLFNVRSAGTEFAREAMAPPAVPAIKMAGKRFARYPVPIVLERQQRAHNRFGSGDVAQERTLRTARALRRGVPLGHRETWETSGAPCRGLLHSDTRRARTNSQCRVIHCVNSFRHYSNAICPKARSRSTRPSNSASSRRILTRSPMLTRPEILPSRNTTAWR